MGAIESLKTFFEVNEKEAALAVQIAALQGESKAALDAAIASLDRGKTYVWLRSNEKAAVIHFANDVPNVLEVEVLTEEVSDAVPAENVIPFQAPAVPQDEYSPEPVPLAIAEPVPARVDPPTPA